MIQAVKGTILTVDDEQSVCDILAAILEPEGYVVLSANSGEEALGFFADNRIDVVFTDIHMEGMSGFELLSRIVNLDNLIKVIVMTGFGGYDTVLQSLQSGAYDYLEKPLEDHSLIVSAARKASEFVTLSRDNQTLLAKLKTSHSHLAAANSQLVSLNKQLKTQSVTDPLTKLFNRRYIDLVLQREYERYIRYKQPFSVLMLDIDNFKEFNNTYGPDQGDKALVSVAGLLRDHSRSSDIIVRYGSDEYCILLTQTSPAEALIVANRISTAFANLTLKIGDELVSTGASIGICGTDSTDEATTESDMLSLSEKALDRAKEIGPNEIQVYDPNDPFFGSTTLSVATG